MARRSADVRPKIILRPTAGTGTSYVTEKNRRNTPDRLVLRKYDPRVRARDASPTRLVNRDVVDGRPRSVYRRFGLSRIRLRGMARRGELPGVTKSSW